MPYVVTFTINIPQMLAYLPWILWGMVYDGKQDNEIDDLGERINLGNLQM